MKSQREFLLIIVSVQLGTHINVALCTLSSARKNFETSSGFGSPVNIVLMMKVVSIVVYSSLETTENT